MTHTTVTGRRTTPPSSHGRTTAGSLKTSPVMARRRAQAARRDARRRPLRGHGGPDAGGRKADEFQSDWDQSGGGFGDDNDLEWISYLTGERPVQPKPHEEDEPQRRSSGRQERARSRRGRGRSAQSDPGSAASPGRRGQGPPPISAPFPVQPPPSPSVPEDRAATTDPGRGRTAARAPGYGPAGTQTDQPAARRSRRGRDSDAGRDA